MIVVEIYVCYSVLHIIQGSHAFLLDIKDFKDKNENFVKQFLRRM